MISYIIAWRCLERYVTVNKLSDEYQLLIHDKKYIEVSFAILIDNKVHAKGY